MTDLNKERELFLNFHYEQYLKENPEVDKENAKYIYDYAHKNILVEQLRESHFIVWLAAKAQAVPTWISVKDEEPPTDTMVLICWSDSPDVQPEIDYMTCDEDLNHIWANFEIDPPTHWMYFHKVPSESGAEG